MFQNSLSMIFLKAEYNFLTFNNFFYLINKVWSNHCEQKRVPMFWFASGISIVEVIDRVPCRKSIAGSENHLSSPQLHGFLCWLLLQQLSISISCQRAANFWLSSECTTVAQLWKNHIQITQKSHGARNVRQLTINWKIPDFLRKFFPSTLK